MVSQFVHIFNIISYFATELDEPKTGISGKELINEKISDLPKLKAFAEDTSNETQNLKFRNLCFEGQKTLWEKEKMPITSIFSFSLQSFKRLLSQGH